MRRIAALTIITIGLMIWINQSPAKDIINPLIDFPSFIAESKNVYEYRKDRRVSASQFMHLAKEPNTIILDTRSKAAYDSIHLKDAIHLNFSDFTEGKLAKIIPSKNTRVLIYCNNNFKVSAAKQKKKKALPDSLGAKYEPYALNIPTFIHLYGYGYKNIYELGPAVDFNDTALRFESL